MSKWQSLARSFKLTRPCSSSRVRQRCVIMCCLCVRTSTVVFQLKVVESWPVLLLLQWASLPVLHASIVELLYTLTRSTGVYSYLSKKNVQTTACRCSLTFLSRAIYCHSRSHIYNITVNVKYVFMWLRTFCALSPKQVWYSNNILLYACWNTTTV